MQLIFVYNANSGKINALFDIAHKLFRPETYDCSLCSLTHDAFTENQLLKELKNNSNFNIEFLHKDEFKAKYNLDFDYPVILKNEQKLELLINHREISKIKDLRELIETLELKNSEDRPNQKS
ncbi:hypothetical protein PQO03_01650 [Lentisphaera profundi]|uniref:GTPase n=1 Tax=Lentisphaera profundi TaxID=1658616 RepID=A0ABY7VV19_9BACT|nr:hypothetical protein [Lentisphaera profundi]WDE96671.1 hypothetical protein PQO03_01650 [Lentisphaera profundi]